MSILTLGRRNPLKQLSPNQLLFKNYQLDHRQKLIMITWGVVLSQLASPVGSSIYFIVTQTSLTWAYPKGHRVFADGYLGDVWDRLPVHVENLLGQHWFSTTSAPGWWVTARHDARHVLIGVAAMMLVTMVTVGMGKRDRKPVGRLHVLLSPVLVLLAAVPGTTIGILFFTHVWPGVMQVGVAANANPYLVEWLGKSSWQLTLIGVIGGIGAKMAFRPVAATLQLVSIDNKMLRGETEKWWWRYVYTPAYRERFAYLLRCDHKPKQHGRFLGFVLAVGCFVFVLFLAFGIWVRYFGPAAGVH